MKKLKQTAAALLAVLLLTACGGNGSTTITCPPATWQENYDLGIRYLGESNYQEAILTFLAAIDIDPKQMNAYVGLAEVYEKQEDYVNALLILQQAMEVPDGIGGETLHEVLERIRQASGIWSVNKSVHADGSYYIRARDERGQIIFHRNYRADGTLDTADEYQYDEQGRQVGILSYNAAGKLARETVFDPTRPDWSRTRSYDYDDAGVLTGSTVYEYDRIGTNKEGNPVIGPIRTENYDAAGVMYYALDEEYNEQAEVIGSRKYNGDGVLEMYSVTEYDVPGMKSRRTFYSADGSLETVEEYYEKGWTQIFYDENGKERHRIVYD